MEYFAGQITVSEQIRVLKRHLDLTTKLVKETHFNIDEIERLILMYYQVMRDGNGTFMTDKQLDGIFATCLDMTNDEMITHVLTVLKKKATSEITIEQWIHTLSLFLRGTFEEHIRFCYLVYDRQGLGRITKEAAFLLLKRTLFSNESSRMYDEDSVRDLVEVLMQKIDADRDGKISFEDYRTACLKNSSFMQFLGECLPERQSAQKFLNTFITDSKILYY